VARIHAFGPDLTVQELTGAGVALSEAPPAVTTMETAPLGVPAVPAAGVVVEASASDSADAEQATASREEKKASFRRHHR
jgi:hypothetical protein